MREIKVFSSKRNNLTVVKSDATTWGALSSQLIEEGYDLTGLVASENVNRCTLENEGAILPEGNFTLFLRQKDGKGGLGLSFSELRKLAKENFEFKQYLVNNSTNWTQLSTTKLNEYYDAFCNTPADKKVTETPVVKEVSDNMEYFKDDLADLIDEYEDTDVNEFVKLLKEVYNAFEESLSILENAVKTPDPVEEARREYEEFMDGVIN